MCSPKAIDCKGSLAGERQLVQHAMSKRTWACFDCRQSVRRAARYGDAARNESVVCPECGGECANIGYKIPLPPRRDRRGWDDLRRQLVAEEHARSEEDKREVVVRRHQIEREIVELEARPRNSERARLVRELRRRLGGG